MEMVERASGGGRRGEVGEVRVEEESETCGEDGRWRKRWMGLEKGGGGERGKVGCGGKGRERDTSQRMGT